MISATRCSQRIPDGIAQQQWKGLVNLRALVEQTLGQRGPESPEPPQEAPARHQFIMTTHTTANATTAAVREMANT